MIVISILDNRKTYVDVVFKVNLKFKLFDPPKISRDQNKQTIIVRITGPDHWSN